MKKLYILFLLLAFTLSQVGCSSNQAVTEEEVTGKPVKVITLDNQITDITLDYVGIVELSSTNKISFKSSGKIGKIFVSKGDDIKKGTQLAELEKQELQIANDAAQAQLSAANAQYDKAVNGATKEDINNAKLNVDKAQDAYDYAQDNYDKLVQLKESGVVSQSELDQAELQVNIRKTELEQAQQVYTQAENGTRSEDIKALSAQVEQARANLELKNQMLSDADLISNVDGKVIEVLYEEGELVSAGYPVVVVGSNQKLVSVGVTDEDLNKLSIGTIVKLSSNNETADGEITYISTVPDTQTRTYNIEISLQDSQFTVGAIADVEFILGQEKGIWIPITSITSKGKDIVYIEKDGVAVKTDVAIEDTKGTLVKVQGLNDNDKLITEGFNRIKDGDKLIVQN